MTTFMAKLLQKLTEMSCKIANQSINETNDFIMALERDELVRKGHFESRINNELPIILTKPIEFSRDEVLKFTNNT